MHHQTSRDPYDVCIVGAGPSGATCAYYLALPGLRVLLLEKKRFPRHKLCGDAVCTGAELVEQSPVSRVEFSPQPGYWTLHCPAAPVASYQARVLVLADGALSRLALR